jgi:hypothetical protein
MGHLRTLKLFGSPATGNIEEGNGFGFRAIGRGGRGLTRFGCLATGRPEGVAGSGVKDIGSIVEFRFAVMSSVVTTRVFGVNNNNFNISSLAPN